MENFNQHNLAIVDIILQDFLRFSTVPFTTNGKGVDCYQEKLNLRGNSPSCRMVHQI